MKYGFQGNLSLRDSVCRVSPINRSRGIIMAIAVKRARYTNMRVPFLLLAITFAAVTNVWAQGNAEWTEPFPPFHIAGNLYYVGSKGLANYLITTPLGHILINSDLEA